MFADVDGKVTSVKVKHAQEVTKGQTLAEMQSNTMELALKETLGRKQIVVAELDGIERELLDRSNPQADQLRIRQVSLETELESIDAQLAILEEENSKLIVKSPIDGSVITWNVQELLRNRPIRRGEIVFEIANLDSDWRLELDLPDRRIGHVLRAQQELGEELKVEFILASDPGKTMYGKIASVGKATEAAPEAGQTIRVNVAIEVSEISEEVLQAKTCVTAKIYCGRKALGSVDRPD